MSTPAALSAAICCRVALTSWVGVVVIDCTLIWASPPTLTPPTSIWWVVFRCGGWRCAACVGVVGRIGSDLAIAGTNVPVDPPSDASSGGALWTTRRPPGGLWTAVGGGAGSGAPCDGMHHLHDPHHRAVDPPVWGDQPAFLTDLAVADLEAGMAVRATLVAFRGEQPLVLATLRPFASGAHHDAIIEVAALAWSLRADRVALSLSGRAWSLEDPVPPVVEGVGDLRQRVVVVHVAEATPDRDDGDARRGGSRTSRGGARTSRGGSRISRGRSTTHLTPVDVHDDGEVTCGEVLVRDDGVGWVADALTALVTADPPIGSAFVLGQEAEAQAERCTALGHTLAFPTAPAPRPG